jgi:thiol-disulfide isomerase/thioredoxin
MAVVAAGWAAALLTGCAAAGSGPVAAVGVGVTAADSATGEAADSGAASGVPSKQAASPTPHSAAPRGKATPARGATPIPTHDPTPAVRKASPSPASGHATPAPLPLPLPSPLRTQTSDVAPRRAGSAGTLVASGYSKTADAQALIDAARAASRADGRPVLLDFGATWCGNCAAMDRALHLPAVQSALAAYHFVQIDIGDGVASNMQILGRYDSHPAGGSYGMPVLIVLSPSGAMRVDTARAGNPFFDEAHFVGFLRRWAA